MDTRIYLFSKHISCHFVLYLRRNFLDFGVYDRIDNAVLYLVAAAATNARGRRAELFYLSGVSDKYKKLGRTAGNIRNFKQSVFVFEISKGRKRNLKLNPALTLALILHIVVMRSFRQLANG